MLEASEISSFETSVEIDGLSEDSKVGDSEVLCSNHGNLQNLILNYLLQKR